jgi:RNA polymerase sigma factor (sigma-70 family)
VLTSDPDAAEEIAQEALTRLLEQRRVELADERALPYLRGIVVNLVRMRSRRLAVERAWVRRVSSYRADESVDASADTAIVLERAVAALPVRRRACVVLRYYCDLTDEAIATTLGISEGTVKSQLHKAVRQLRKAYVGEQEATP